MSFAFVIASAKSLSFEGDKNSLPIALLGEPVDGTAPVDALRFKAVGVAVHTLTGNTPTVTLDQKETSVNLGLPEQKEVEPRGVEPLTSSMPLRRSTN